MSMAMFNSYISLPEGIYNLYGNGESLKKNKVCSCENMWKPSINENFLLPCVIFPLSTFPTYIQSPIYQRFSDVFVIIWVKTLMAALQPRPGLACTMLLCCCSRCSCCSCWLRLSSVASSRAWSMARKWTASNVLWMWYKVGK